MSMRAGKKAAEDLVQMAESPPVVRGTIGGAPAGEESGGTGAGVVQTLDKRAALAARLASAVADGLILAPAGSGGFAVFCDPAEVIGAYPAEEQVSRDRA